MFRTLVVGFYYFILNCIVNLIDVGSSFRHCMSIFQSNSLKVIENQSKTVKQIIKSYITKYQTNIRTSIQNSKTDKHICR